MEEKINISSRIMYNDPNLISLFGYHRSFKWGHIWSWFSSRCRGGLPKLWRVLRGREYRELGIMDRISINILQDEKRMVV